MRYLTTWFLVDVISVFQFDLFLDAGISNVNQLTRISRIGKFYKILKMTRIFKMLRIVRVKNKLARHLHDVLKIGAGNERLLFLIIMFLVLVHVLACAWIFIGRYDPDSKQNWIYVFGMTDYS